MVQRATHGTRFRRVSRRTSAAARTRLRVFGRQSLALEGARIHRGAVGILTLHVREIGIVVRHAHNAPDNRHRSRRPRPQ